MQNDETDTNNEPTEEIKTVEIDQENQTAAMTGQSLPENPPVPTSQSTFGLDVSCSEDDEVSEVYICSTLVALSVVKLSIRS